MKNLFFLFPFLVTALGCGGGSQPAAATPQSGGRISVSSNSTLLHCIGTALGRCYEFGLGVPQNRQNAIYWFKKAGAQGMGQGDYFARWLKDPTNNIGFRNDAEHNLVIAGKLRFGLGADDPAGITFVNSAQRNRWLTGLRNEVDKSEAQSFWNMNKSEYDRCRSSGGSSCMPPGPEPERH